MRQPVSRAQIWAFACFGASVLMGGLAGVVLSSFVFFVFFVFLGLVATFPFMLGESGRRDWRYGGFFFPLVRLCHLRSMKGVLEEQRAERFSAAFALVWDRWWCEIEQREIAGWVLLCLFCLALGYKYQPTWTPLWIAFSLKYTLWDAAVAWWVHRAIREEMPSHRPPAAAHGNV